MDRREQIDEAEKHFIAAQAELTEWEEEHAALMNDYFYLVAKRESARERLVLAVSNTGLPGGGIKVVKQVKRTFDGKKLRYLVQDEKLRDELVTIVYKVNTKAFDQAVREGTLTPDIAEHVTLKTEVNMQLRNKPTPITLG